MILSLYSPTNFQWSRVIQIFSRMERKSLHLVLPCVLLRSFHVSLFPGVPLFPCQILQRKCSGRTCSSTRMLLFWQRRKDNPERVFRQEWFWARKLSLRYIFSCCLIHKNARISLHMVLNSKLNDQVGLDKEKLT